MSQEIERAAKEIVDHHFCRQLKGLHAVRIRATSQEIQVSGQVDADPISASNFLRLCFNHGAQEIHLPTIYIPSVLRHQNIGKSFIAQIFKFAEEIGYQFFVVNLVSSFYKKLVERGAEIIKEEECVRITPTTNLAPRSKEEIFSNAFGISLTPDDPVAEAHHWGTLPDSLEEMQEAEIQLFLGSAGSRYTGTLNISAHPTDADLFSTVVVINDVMMGFGNPIISLRLRIPGEHQEQIVRSSDPESDAPFSVTAPTTVFKPYGPPTQFAPEEE